MKEPTASFRWLFGFAFMAIAVTGCQTTERPQMCTVVDLRGEARYWDAQSNTVHTIRLGDRIPPDSTIQTAKGRNNIVSLATGKRLPKPYLNYPSTFDPQDEVRIHGDSILKLSKVTLRNVGTDRIPDTRLQLLQGTVTFDARPTSREQVSKRETSAPYHEVRSSNVVVRAESAAFFFAASGVTRVILGSATLERTDQGVTRELPPWHGYDPVTGEISAIEKDYANYYNSVGGGDTFPPDPPWELKFQVPQRPF